VTVRTALVACVLALTACASGGDDRSDAGPPEVDAALGDGGAGTDGRASDGATVDGSGGDGGGGSCAGPPDRDLEPNNGPTGASPIPTQASFRLPNLGICSSGDVDYFTLTVGAGAHINARIEFSHAAGDLNLALLDAAATQLVFSDNSSAAMTPALETVDRTGLGAGKYYLRVQGKDAQTLSPYTLVVTVN